MENDNKLNMRYLYCLVTPENANRSYYYISEIEDVQKSDVVVIPFGMNNKEVFGTVLSAEWFAEADAPYPHNFTKKILRKATEEEKYRLIEPDITEYTYCYVIPEGQTRGFSYISEPDEFREGDMVIIPFGADNHEVFGKVSSVKRVKARTAPYPPEKTKRILRKAVSEEQYEFLTVLPITHKQKTFGYINTLPNVEVGDYVDIEFRGGYRIAQVLSKKKGSLTEAPPNFMGTMKVLRTRSYADCEYIRFKTDLAPLAQTGELYRAEDVSEKTNSFRNPRLTSKAVETFEKVYGVRLPDDFKHYVTEISNGYDFIIGLNVEEYREEYTTLRKVFLYSDLVDSAKSGDSPRGLRYECEYDDCSACNHKFVCPDSDFEYDPYDYDGENTRFRDGTLRLTHSGDITDRMIVNGKYTGTVIRLDEYSGTRTVFADSFHEYLQILAGNSVRTNRDE